MYDIVCHHPGGYSSSEHDYTTVLQYDIEAGRDLIIKQCLVCKRITANVMLLGPVVVADTKADKKTRIAKMITELFMVGR